MTKKSTRSLHSSTPRVANIYNKVNYKSLGQTISALASVNDSQRTSTLWTGCCGRSYALSLSTAKCMGSKAAGLADTIVVENGGRCAWCRVDVTLLLVFRGS